jgi:hypothetical protein
MLTAILDRRRHDLQLVGAKVYSDDKNGADVGTLAGRDPIGVSATTDVDAIRALDADCVLYVPRTSMTCARCWPPARTSPPRRSCSIRVGWTRLTATGYSRRARGVAPPYTAAA